MGKCYEIDSSATSIAFPRSLRLLELTKRDVYPRVVLQCMYRAERATILVFALIFISVLVLISVHSLIHKSLVFKESSYLFNDRKVLFALEGERVCSADA